MKTGLLFIAGSVGVAFLTLTIMAMTVMGNGANPVANTVMYGGGGVAALLMLAGIVTVIRALL